MVGAMHERIREDLVTKERALWTALTSADPGHSVKKLCSDDANLIFPNKEILALDNMEESKFEKELAAPFHHFDDYALSNVRVLVLDLMAGVVTYKLEAIRGNKRYQANGSSVWSQGSDGEWRLNVHTESLF